MLELDLDVRLDLKLNLELRIKNNVLVVDKIYCKDLDGIPKDTINTCKDIATKFTGIAYTGSSLLELFSGVAEETLTVETKWTIFTKQLVSVATKGTLSSTAGVKEVKLDYIQIDDLYEIDSEGKLWV